MRRAGHKMMPRAGRKIRKRHAAPADTRADAPQAGHAAESTAQECTAQECTAQECRTPLAGRPGADPPGGGRVSGGLILEGALTDEL